MPIEWYYLHIWGCLNFSWQSWVQLVSFPAQHFSWCTLHMLNKQGENIHTFPNFESVHHSMSSSNCCFLTCTQVSQEARQVVWYSHHVQNFPQLIVIHTVKGFDLVNKAEIDIFLLISGSSAFSKTSLNIWKFMVHILLKPDWRILSITLLVCEMSAIVL